MSTVHLECPNAPHCLFLVWGSLLYIFVVAIQWGTVSNTHHNARHMPGGSQLVMDVNFRKKVGLLRFKNLRLMSLDRAEASRAPFHWSQGQKIQGQKWGDHWPTSADCLLFAMLQVLNYIVLSPLMWVDELFTCELHAMTWRWKC